MGFLAVGSGTALGSSVGFWETVPCTGLLHPTLMHGEELVLSQLDVLCFADLPWKAYPFLNRDRGMDLGVGQ